MKKQILNIVGLLIILTGMTVSTTYAQSIVKVDIPFDFNVQNKTVKSGNYRISRNDSQGWIWLLDNTDTGKRVVLLQAIAETKRDTGKGKLIFHRYGEMYFLTTVETSAYKVGLPKSRFERNLIKELRTKNDSRAVAPEIYTLEFTID
jgi:hypothetical protein